MPLTASASSRQTSSGTAKSRRDGSSGRMFRIPGMSAPPGKSRSYSSSRLTISPLTTNDSVAPGPLLSRLLSKVYELLKVSPGSFPTPTSTIDGSPGAERLSPTRKRTVPSRITSGSAGSRISDSDRANFKDATFLDASYVTSSGWNETSSNVSAVSFV